MEEKHNNDPEILEGGGEEPKAEQHPMAALMEDALAFRAPKPGDIVEGEIVSVSPTEVLVDVGGKSEGLVPSKELERLGREGLESLHVGDTVSVYIVRAEDREGNMILSIRRAEEENDWRRAQKQYEQGESFETTVAGFNKGGLIVRFGKVRGFVPASQVSRERQQRATSGSPEERWGQMVGEDIAVKVVEIDRARNRLILSERAAAREWREKQKGRLLGTLHEGEVRKGRVSSICDFGAFVDVGGADGLVHLSELSWSRVRHPAEVLQIGQEVDVFVLGINAEEKKKGGVAVPDIFSTHPPLPDRAKRAREAANYAARPAMTEAEWQAVRDMCGAARPRN